MTDTQRTESKKRILEMVQRSGMPVRTSSILRRVNLPQETELSSLLAELVMEGRLLRQPTLLANGEVGYLYDVP